MKPYEQETKCSWYCPSLDVAIYMLDLTYEPANKRVTATYRPICTSCANYLISSNTVYHKPFKRDVYTALITRTLEGWT